MMADEDPPEPSRDPTPWSASSSPCSPACSPMRMMRAWWPSAQDSPWLGWFLARRMEVDSGGWGEMEPGGEACAEHMGGTSVERAGFYCAPPRARPSICRIATFVSTNHRRRSACVIRSAARSSSSRWCSQPQPSSLLFGSESCKALQL